VKDKIKLELEQLAMRERARHGRVATAPEDEAKGEPTRFGDNLASTPHPFEIAQNVKDQIKLRREQETTRHRTAIAQPDDAKPDEHFFIRRRLAATILLYDRNWPAHEIARLFEWPIDRVEAWFLAGQGLL
jgi:hypothetical protein